MIESVQHADKELKWFKQRFGERLTEEDYRILRLEMITAFRSGYDLACKNQFDIKREDDCTMKQDGYIQGLNEEFGVSLVGISPLLGTKKIPKNATRIVVKDFGNGLGRVIYVDGQNRLIANNMEPVK